MSYYTKIDALPVNVGVVSQQVVAPFSCRGEDIPMVFIENTSLTETFNGTVSTAPTVNGPWTDEPDDSFASMAPGRTRRWVGDPTKHIFVRVLGYFDAAPGTVEVTVLLNRASWPMAQRTA